MAVDIDGGSDRLHHTACTHLKLGGCCGVVGGMPGSCNTQLMLTGGA